MMGCAGDCSQEFQLQGGVEKHAEKETSVAPTIDVRFPIASVAVSNRDITDFEV